MLLSYELPPSRLDKGTETGLMATIHGFLKKDDRDITNAEETVQYGPSTINKVVLQ